MSGFAPEDMDSLLQATCPDFNNGKLIRLTLQMTDYVGVELFQGMPKKAVMKGLPFQWSMRPEKKDTAHAVGLYETEDPVAFDSQTDAKVFPCSNRDSYAFDLDEDNLNEANAIMNLAPARRDDAKESLLELRESQVWDGRSSPSDKKTMLGVRNWVVTNSSSSPGFLGANPSGFSTLANVDWDFDGGRNWAGSYASLVGDAIVDPLITMMKKTGFKSQWHRNDFGVGKDTAGYYMGLETELALSKIARGQNSNVGWDLTGGYGRTLFNGNPLTYVPFLDDATDAPIFQLNFRYWKNVMPKGRPMSTEKRAADSRTQPDSVVYYIREWGQLACFSKRNQGVLIAA